MKDEVEDFCGIEVYVHSSRVTERHLLLEIGHAVNSARGTF